MLERFYGAGKSQLTDEVPDFLIKNRDGTESVIWVFKVVRTGTNSILRDRFFRRITL